MLFKYQKQIVEVGRLSDSQTEREANVKRYMEFKYQNEYELCICNYVGSIVNNYSVYSTKGQLLKCLPQGLWAIKLKQIVYLHEKVKKQIKRINIFKEIVTFKWNLLDTAEVGPAIKTIYQTETASGPQELPVSQTGTELIKYLHKCGRIYILHLWIAHAPLAQPEWEQCR